MNLSLRNRVAFSFIVAMFVILVLAFTVFTFLHSFEKDIEKTTRKAKEVMSITDDIKIETVALLKKQRNLISKGVSAERVDQIIKICESLSGMLNVLGSHSKDAEEKKIVVQMRSYIDSLMLVLKKVAIHNRDNVGMSTIGDLADKILDTFSNLSEVQYIIAESRNSDIEKIIDETRRKMMITIIIGFLGTIILTLVVPGKIALPFKKIKDAIRELQDCNFDVSIYYNQDDEIGEIAREMNKMIHSFKVFDELRTDRISVELRKFDALANMVKKPVLVSSAVGELIYMNNKMYSILQIQSDDFMGKNMADTLIPNAVRESFELAIKRRAKIENTEIKILAKKDDATLSENGINNGLQMNESGEEMEGPSSTEEIIFNGYANVIPIRGKESALDYYLMVLSTEVFV